MVRGKGGWARDCVVRATPRLEEVGAAERQAQVLGCVWIFLRTEVAYEAIETDAAFFRAVWWLCAIVITVAVVLLSIYRDTIIEKCVLFRGAYRSRALPDDDLS